MRNKRGITLIALIITVIVMLILAGVSLNAIVGDNGIITQAQRAKELAEETELKEQVDMVLVEAAGMDFETDSDYLKFVNDSFKSRGLSATLQADSSGAFALIYGKNKKKVEYITKDLKTLASAIEVVEGNPSDWIYRVDEKTNKAILTGFNYDNLGSSITIPNVIDGYLISELSDQVFMFRTNLESVNFSNGLTRIGKKAFSGCTNLTAIGSFPTTLTSIGEEAFYGCEKMNLDLTFNPEMQKIEDKAFYNCKNITGTVTNLIRTDIEYGQNVFSGCSKITGDIGEALEVLITEDMTKIPDNLFSGMSGLTGTITIGPNIEEIGDYAFYYCSNVTGLDISQAVKIDINGTETSTLKRIGDNAFYACSKITGSLNFLDGLQYIGIWAFKSCGLDGSVTLPSTLTEVWEETFGDCKIKKVTLNCGDVFKYKDWGGAFLRNGRLTEVVFGNSCTMTILPTKIFRNCSSLESISLPDSITIIQSDALSGCGNLKSVTYPSNLTKIGKSAFIDDPVLTTLPIANNKLISSLTEISESAFSNCMLIGYDENTSNNTTNLISLLTASNMTTIGSKAFYGCQYLTGVIDGDKGLTNKNSTEENIVKITFVGDSFDSRYISYGKEFKTTDENGNAITSIPNNAYVGVTAFSNNGGTTEIIIPEGVTSIGSHAFDGCVSLTKVTFPSTLQYIYSNAFENCSSLVEVVTNNCPVTTLSSYVFSHCTSLSTIGSFPSATLIGTWAFHSVPLTSFNFSRITTIGNAAFALTNLANITLPSSLTSIDNYAFSSIKTLKSIDFSNCTKLTRLPSYCCSSCDQLTNVTLGSNMTRLEDNCFFNCIALTTIDIPDSITFLGNYCFNGCTSLITVLGCENMIDIGACCFKDCKALTSVARVWCCDSNLFLCIF